MQGRLGVEGMGDAAGAQTDSLQGAVVVGAGVADGQADVALLPEGAGEVTSLAYSEFFRLSEDFDYIYIFRDKFGGYMIPKESLKEEEGQFRRFLQEKTGQTIYRKTSPAMRVFKEVKLFASRKNEPPHL